MSLDLQQNGITTLQPPILQIQGGNIPTLVNYQVNMFEYVKPAGELLIIITSTDFTPSCFRPRQPVLSLEISRNVQGLHKTMYSMTCAPFWTIIRSLKLGINLRTSA